MINLFKKNNSRNRIIKAKLYIKIIYNFILLVI